jgi:hypothetical protein
MVIDKTSVYVYACMCVGMLHAHTYIHTYIEDCADTIRMVVDTKSISMFMKTHTYVHTYIHKHIHKGLCKQVLYTWL